MFRTTPKCQSGVIKKNGTIHNGKQKYECLSCHRQFVENPENKVVSDDTKERIRRALLERVSLEGLCRIFDVSMPWLLQFMEKIYEELPPIISVELIQITDKTSIPFAPKAKKIIEKGTRRKSRRKLI